MKHCHHSNWLGLSTSGNETFLLESGRLQNLVHDIPYPDLQCPSLFVLIGNAAKSLALQELGAAKQVRRANGKRAHGEIHLQFNSSTVFQRRLVLFADGDLPENPSRIKTPLVEKCHETIKRALPRVREGVPALPLPSVADKLFSGLLHPFADVFCFFSADLGGFRPIARHVAAWLENDKASTLPGSTHPRLIVVTESIHPEAEKEKEARESFVRILGEETQKDPFARFSSVEIVAIFPESQVSAQARHRRLKECLTSASNLVWKAREETRTLFSARHFAAFFRHACAHFASTSKDPFDFIKTSRHYNPVATDLHDHLSNFLRNVHSSKELTEFAVPVIASTFLVDSYPPDSHLFSPAEVLKVLYKDVCQRVSRTALLAHRGSVEMVLPSGFVKMIEGQLLQYFGRLVQGTEKHSAEIHNENLKRFERRFQTIRSNDTCLVCLRRRPQYGLPCGHCVCENCVVVFGERNVQDPWVFNIRHCFLCGLETPDVAVKVHPPTAGVGVLCIDGGGARGVLPLKFMKLIQDRIGLPIPVQKFFKVVFGVSSGGLIALGMFVNGWSIEDCTQSFETLAKIAFKRRKVLDVPILSGVQELLVSYLADSLYPAENLEAALKEVFGGDRSISDYSHATSIGAKVVLPVATILETALCLFTNYNGVGVRDRNCGYHVLRPKDGTQRVPLWEIARSASAAPGFFRPKRINGLGTFQDAGPIQNNPLSSALSEVEAMFPLVEEPDFVVSLGTGAPRSNSDNPSTSGPRGILKDGCIPRLLRAWWESMRGNRAWQAHTGSGRPKSSGKYHRLDVEFDGVEPRLDDINSIPMLRSKALEDPLTSTVIDNIAHCAIASLFYFELDALPRTINGEYVGTGNLLCVLRQDEPALRVLLSQLSRSSAVFLLDNCQLSGTTDSCSSTDKDGNFRKRVEFNVRDRFSICLKEGDSQPRNISGSPFSMDRMISAQGLDAHFGRADHRKRPADGDYPEAKRRRM